tara:strand:+ start:233 stop:352 length:120 start_codon:yes stop_codon:yes gene_type:complete
MHRNQAGAKALRAKRLIEAYKAPNKKDQFTKARGIALTK